MKLKYEIIYNQYQSKYVVFATNENSFNVKGIFSANTRKECVEWLKGYKKGSIERKNNYEFEC